ncbi:cell wall-binding repeat-containing protein [Desulfosporosinus sp. BG]|uniref:cell wall-binding repeat-containing protein n=1 Tax=Desulfosporosinus sp. BG TaxID=1633135 RepID=UPI0008581E63|nr:cell wall-binding repeat-containing protein [Desulfosporosinus sp. BG]ODA40172.1 N-acetylmuramoyl-L-alanine amidase [Desulfosporosinus sp. BG]
MKKSKKVLASLAIAGMLSMIPFNALAENAIPTRLGGTVAAQTAVQIADHTGWTGTAILSSSTSYGMVDALTAGPLASFLKAPILLQEAGNVLNPDTKAELVKLEVKTVYVTSGTAVISQAVLDQLTSMGIKIVPLGGSDRFETAVNIAKQMVALGANVNKVAVAYGWLNQDALSIAPIAAAQTEPILLTDKDKIPESVIAFLAANRGVTASHVIGGTGVISERVKAQFPNATRLFGNTAYDTNLAVLKAFESILKYDHIFLANGQTAIDALAGAPLAALYNAGIVLTNGTANEATTYVAGRLSIGSIITALGGIAVVPEAVRSGVADKVPTQPSEPSNPSSGGGGGGGGGGGSTNRDKTAPVITLNGAATVNVANGATYIDAGATVTDNKDTGLTVTVSYTKDGSSVGSINTFVAGTYLVHYNVSDAAGNAAAEVTRTVIVAPAVIDLNAPQITATTFGAAITSNTLSFSFADLKKDSAITVSKDAKLSFSIGNSGTIGDFNLKAGSNSILNTPIATNGDLDLSQANMTAIFNAIKDLDAVDKAAVLNTVDFAKVLELVQQTDSTTQNAVFAQIGFEDFYAAIRNASPDLKEKIFNNMMNVISVSLNSNNTVFRSDVEGIMKNVVEAIPSLSAAQKVVIYDFYINQDTDITKLFNDLALTVDQKDFLFTNMDYTALFAAMMNDLTPETRATMFETINFTDLFNAIKSADEAQKDQIYQNIFGTMDVINASSIISRPELLDALVYGADKKDALFQILRNLCEPSGDVTATVTLTDADSQTSTYTFIISE